MQEDIIKALEIKHAEDRLQLDGDESGCNHAPEIEELNHQLADKVEASLS